MVQDKKYEEYLTSRKMVVAERQRPPVPTRSSNGAGRGLQRQQSVLQIGGQVASEDLSHTVRVKEQFFTSLEIPVLSVDQRVPESVGEQDAEHSGIVHSGAVDSGAVASVGGVEVEERIDAGRDDDMTTRSADKRLEQVMSEPVQP